MTTPHQPQPHTDGWQDIATAPREDEDFKILAYDADTGTMDVVWLSWLKDDSRDVRKWFNGDVVDIFTHWMTLPKPPSTTQSNIGETE